MGINKTKEIRIKGGEDRRKIGVVWLKMEEYVVTVKSNERLKSKEGQKEQKSTWHRGTVNTVQTKKDCRKRENKETVGAGDI